MKQYKPKKYELGVQKVYVSPGAQGTESLNKAIGYGTTGMQYGSQLGSLAGPMGGAIGAGVGLVGGGIYGAIQGQKDAQMLDQQRMKEQQVNSNIDYQNNNYGGIEKLQQKNLFDSVGYVSNRDIMAKNGMKYTPKKKIEVEKDEMIFRKDPNTGKTMLVADFKGGQPHSKGGEDFLAQEGDVIYPGNMRDEIKSLVGPDGYIKDEKTFEMYRQQLPADSESKEQFRTGGVYGVNPTNTMSAEEAYNKAYNTTKNTMSAEEAYNKAYNTTKNTMSALSMGSMLGLTQLSGDTRKTENQIMKEKEALKKNKSVPFLNSFFQTPEEYWGSADKVENTTKAPIGSNKSDSNSEETPYYNASYYNSKPTSYSNYGVESANSSQVNKNAERFSVVNGEYRDSQWKSNETEQEKAARKVDFNSWLAKQNESKSKSDYLRKMAKPELPTDYKEIDNSQFEYKTDESKIPFLAAQNKDENIPFNKDYKTNEVSGNELDDKFNNLKYKYNQNKQYKEGTAYFNPNDDKTSLIGTNVNPYQNLLPNYLNNKYNSYSPNINPSIQHTVASGEGWGQINKQYRLKPGTVKEFNKNESGEVQIGNRNDAIRNNSFQLEKKKEWGDNLLHPNETVNVPYNKYKGLPSNFSTSQNLDENGNPYGNGYTEDQKSPYYNGMYPSLGTDSSFKIPNLSGDVSNMADGIPTTASPLERTNEADAYRKANPLAPVANPGPNPDYLRTIKGLVPMVGNSLYNLGLMNEKADVREATNLQFDNLKYEDRSNPLRKDNLTGLKSNNMNATNYAGGSASNMIAAMNANQNAYNTQDTQIENNEMMRADQIATQNVGINNQEAQLNSQYYDQNVIANEQNLAKTRDMQRVGRLGVADDLNKFYQNNQVIEKDAKMDAEGKYRFNKMEERYGNELKYKNELTDQESLKNYSELTTKWDTIKNYKDGDPIKEELRKTMEAQKALMIKRGLIKE